MRTSSKKPTNLSLDQSLLQEARHFGINLSQAAETGLKRAVSEARAAEWKRENKEALRGLNEWVEKNGLPLEKYRQF